MDALERKRVRGNQGDRSEGAGKRTRVEELHLAFAFDEEAVREDARRREPSLENIRGVSSSSPLESVDPAISAQTADCRSRSLSKELAAIG